MKANVWPLNCRCSWANRRSHRGELEQRWDVWLMFNIQADINSGFSSYRPTECMRISERMPRGLDLHLRTFLQYTLWSTTTMKIQQKPQMATASAMVQRGWWVETRVDFSYLKHISLQQLDKRAFWLFPLGSQTLARRVEIISHHMKMFYKYFLWCWCWIMKHGVKLSIVPMDGICSH